jgi:hypothetical protein
MNIALSSLILFFLLIPGILFRRLYFSEEFSKQYIKESFFAIFFSSFIPSVFFHSLWFFIFSFKFNLIRLDIFFNILSQNPSINSIENISNSFDWIIWYNSSLFLIAALSGFLLKKVIRNLKADRKYKFLRYKNTWHYILTGESFDFPRANVNLSDDNVEDIEFVFVDALIVVNDSSYLYDGILVDYELSNDDGLEFITIKNAKRRKIDADCSIDEDGNKSDNSKSYYPISGHMLVLKYSEIKNLNFSFYKLQTNDVNEYFPTLIS